MKNLNGRLRDEDGAVSVDWIVLTAAITGLAVATVLSTEGGLNAVSSKIQSSLASKPVE
ncbi:Flp family type IVb pilin [Roseovarius salis]|uniref:Flp family type IVb pilin n=1 Tax=Roseovarius salis TaxID=3376063 RepID=UPI0037CBCC5C